MCKYFAQQLNIMWLKECVTVVLPVLQRLLDLLSGPQPHKLFCNWIRILLWVVHVMCAQIIFNATCMWRQCLHFCRFENRGLLSDLRAYMRQLMVKALTDSNKNEKSLQLKKASSSPKLQAINLLVVDYLFHEDYLYTVSVFSSEVYIFSFTQ